MATDIRVVSLNPASVWVGISGEGGVDEPFKAREVFLELAVGNRVIRAKLPQEFEINQALLKPDPSGRAFKSPAEFAAELKDRLEAERKEVFRKLATQEIVWSESVQAQTFLKLPRGLGANGQGQFHGEVRLYPHHLDVSPTSPEVVAEFVARASLKMTAGGITAWRSIGLALVVHAKDVPRLRLDIDDFNVSFPEVDFPQLDLSVLQKLQLPAVGQGIARAFDRLVGKTDVKFTKQGAGNAELLLDPTGGQFKWQVADSGGGLAKFDIEIDKGGLLAKITGLSVEGSGSDVTVGGAVAVSSSVIIPENHQPFGPLVVRWSGVKLIPVAEAKINGTPIPSLDQTTLRGSVVFERLMIYAADDPSAVIAFRGEVEITPSGVRIVRLDIVEPYPIKLIAKAYDALEHAAESILKLLAEIKAPAAPELPDFIEGLKKLLDVLGRLAAAIGRAAVFVADVASGAAQLIGEALKGIAEVIGRLIKALAELLADAAKAAHRHIAIEVRIATDPFEVRQVLLTLRGDPALPDHDRFSALGFDLDLPTGWEPGLLLDFVACPGAYLIATRQKHDGKEPHFATLSTDLWLKRKNEPVQPMRDADGATGERSQSTGSGKPLLSVSAKVKKDGEFALILAGLRSGKAIFFQKITNVTRKSLATFPGASVVTADGAFAFSELSDGDFDFDVAFEKERVLPLLGMGEPGKEAGGAGGGNAGTGGGFLTSLKNSLSQTVWVKSFVAGKKPGLSAGADLVLGVKAAGVETEVTLKLEVDLKTFEAKFDADAGPINLKSRRIEERALGLVWVVEQTDENDRKANKEVEMFELSFENGESGFTLTDKARMEIRFTDLSSDGRGVVLKVDEFRISRAGLDLSAKVSDEPVRLNGLNVPFKFTTGEFVIRGGRVSRATIGGRGSLPRDLVGEVDCKVLLDFKQDPSSHDIVLQSGKVEFGKKGEPILSHSTRFTLTINELDISFERDGGYHFYFLVTGSLEFTPRENEFESGLLQYLKGVRIELERAPLTADPRVLINHISFQKSLNPKKTFNLFNLFEFELRGFGFHPSSKKFGGSPAMNISGQIKFAQIGDVMQPSIDFHGLWIAPPKPDDWRPRIKADGLGIDIGLSGVAKLRGSVLAVDPETPTLEGMEFAPKGYNAYGFLGEGQLSIEGWGTMSASMGFMEVAPKERPDNRKKSFFLYLEANKLSIEIPVVIWTFYMREVGFGFGYRYTLRGIKDAEAATSTAKLVKTLDDVSKRQGDLSRFTSWLPDPEGDHVTLALRAAFQCFLPPEDWESEKDAQEPFFFDIVAALRSDMTFLMSARGWVATNYSDFFNDQSGSIRHNPGFRGYLFISAPRRELLARCIGDSRGYVGDRLGNIDTLKSALKSIDWSMTLYINPRLFHLELGWPNELVARLRDDKNFRVIIRGGMIFRVAEDGILWGYNIEADAFIAFSGSAGGGSIGVAIEASLTVKFVARLIAYLSWRVKGTLIYGLISLDVNLAFNVRAWMEIDLGVKSFTIRISFSFRVQFSAAVELAISTEGVGALVKAPIAIPVFGCMIWVTVTLKIGGSKLEEARARVQRFMAMGIANESTPDPVKSAASAIADDQVTKGADQAQKAVDAPQVPAPTGSKPPIRRAALGKPIEKTNFWLILHATKAGAEDAIGLLVPREPPAPKLDPAVGAFIDPAVSAFYASPNATFDDKGKRAEGEARHILAYGGVDVSSLKRWNPAATGQDGWLEMSGSYEEIPANWNRAIPAEGKDGEPVSSFTLGHLFDECFLYDADWIASENPYRKTTKWTEPEALRHAPTSDVQGQHEEDRRRHRDNMQRDRAASAAKNPLVVQVYEARSTVMAMFLDQFVSLAENRGLRAANDLKNAHVTDIGLVFRGSAADLEKLGAMYVQKMDATGDGKVEVFNPRDTWFDLRDPILDRTKPAEIDQTGVKLDWRLRLAHADQLDDPEYAKDEYDRRNDPEQFLHHYEITAELNGHDRWKEPKLIKPAALLGGIEERVKEGLKDVAVSQRPEWQFVDDLSDLPETLRRALLPVKGEEDALQAAAAWAARFGDATEVTLTYSIIPVDVAGSKGTERAFVVDVPRPTAPIRPAEAELRFFVDGPHLAREGKEQRPSNLGLVLALRDAAWDEKTKPDGFTAVRAYRLIVDPEEVVPSGNYGSDGLTDGLRSPYSASNRSSSGDEAVFTFERGRLEQAKLDASQVQLVEPDADARSRFTDGWFCLAGKPLPRNPIGALLPEGLTDKEKDDLNTQRALFEVLWGQHPEEPSVRRRVASRFYLETLVYIKDKNNKSLGPPHVSRRVPLNFEVVIQSDKPPTLDAEPVEPVLMRPETFEWPVRLDLPPLGEGQVRAATGFATFRVPAASATLGDIVKGAGVDRIRDPDRRVLTMVEWDAVPDWAASANPLDDAAAAQLLPKPLHAATIGGFDLHELDIDDLAPSDAKPGDVAFAKNTTAWRRARRVARVQILPRSAAMMTPHGNEDLLGWHAHYPSETWRVQNRRGSAGAADNKPMRHGWWSAREATPRFPTRIIRQRVLLLADEAVSTALLSKGKPSRIYVKINATAGSNAEKTLAKGAPAAIAFVCVKAPGGTNLGADFFVNLVATGPWKGWSKVILQSGKSFGPAELRALQLCLSWVPAPEAQKDFASNPGALDGLALDLAGEVDPAGKAYTLTDTNDLVPDLASPPPHVTGSSTVPLVFATPRHAVIEEVLAELELDERKENPPVAYRRFTPVLQPAPKIDSKDVAGFFAATAPAKDPYGWGVLQTLGLSVTLRLFDGDLDQFVAPEDLLDRLNDVATRVVERYHVLLVKDQDQVKVGNALGIPFAEVLLRPGKDRVPAPFDARVSQSTDAHAASPVLDFDHALAAVQFSLRPRVEQVWTYHRIAAAWKRPFPRPEVKVNEDVPVDLLFALKADATHVIDVMRPADARSVELKPVPTPAPGAPEAPLVTLPSLGAPMREGTDADDRLTLIVRAPAALGTDIGQVVQLRTLLRRWKLVDGTTPGEKNPVYDADTVDATDAKNDWLKWTNGCDDWLDGVSVQPIARPGQQLGFAPVDPYDRFDAKTAAQWSDALLGDIVRKDDKIVARVDRLTDAFADLRATVLAALPEVNWPAIMPESGPPDELKSVIPAYIDWAQRFLDHSAAPAEPTTKAPKLHAAFAAPNKATPWRLAAARDGTLSISFLHADRWGHARAYAVKPFGRYQELMIGAHAYADSGIIDRGDAREQLERLIGDSETVLKHPLGYGVAVSPRTERVEAPVILGSKVFGATNKKTNADATDEDVQRRGEWQLVVPRHNEEGLAFSNRPLFARLGWEGVALSFVRDYREPDWPARLRTFFDPEAPAVPEPILHPEIPPKPEWSRPSSQVPAIDDAALGKIAQEFPSLWKGADIYRIARLPHFYRASVLAVARAGISVSPVAVSVQEDFRAEMPSQGLADIFSKRGAATRIVAQRDTDDRSTLEIELPLLSHADLTDAQTRKTWIDDVEKAANIAWWPDPEAVYAFQRIVGDKVSGILEEEAELRLVPRGVGEQPLVLRVRGTRFKAANDAPVVVHSPADQFFSAKLHMILAPATSPLATSMLDSPVTPQEIESFNKNYRQFAVVAPWFRLELAMKPIVGETLDQALLRIESLTEALLAAAADQATPDPGRARQMLWASGRRAADWLRAFRANPPPVLPTPVEAAKQSGLEAIVLDIAWPNAVAPITIGNISDVEVKLSPLPNPPPTHLALLEFPTKKQRTELDNDADVAQAIETALGRAVDNAKQTAFATTQLKGVLPGAIDNFNDAAKRYARIFSRYCLMLDLKPEDNELADKYVVRLDKLAAKLKEAASNALAKAATNPSNIAGTLADIEKRLKQVADKYRLDTSSSAEVVRAACGMPERVQLWWSEKPGPTFADAVLKIDPAEITKDCNFAPVAQDPYLALFDLPTDDEMDGLVLVGEFAEIYIALKKLLNELIAGGAPDLVVRAVHARAGATGSVGVDQAAIKWPRHV